MIKADKKKKLTWEGRLIQHEGYRRNPYTDTEGYLTGGVGHKFTEEDYKSFKPEWSDKQKDAYWAERFEEDLSSAKISAIKIMNEKNIQPTDTVSGVLVDMIFNLGPTGVRNFDNFLTALSAGDIDTAVKEMKLNKEGTGPSKWYTQVGQRVDNLASALQEDYKEQE